MRVAEGELARAFDVLGGAFRQRCIVAQFLREHLHEVRCRARIGQALSHPTMSEMRCMDDGMG